jgi:HPt (histidine-containing phosphotransfer) domain-containing protein
MSADKVTEASDRPQDPDADPGARVGPAPELFDPTGLLEFAEPDELSEFIDMFSAQMSARLPELADAIARDDATAVHEIAHGLKGSAATIGTPRLMAVCDAICAVTKDGSCAGAPALHAQLVDAWTDAARVIAAYLEATGR